jgi:DNA repair protein RecN (Recombination protein N)
VVSILKENLNQIGKLKNVFPDAALIHSRLESVYIELKDIADESALLEERTDIDPDRIEQINQRLDLIYTLQQKHRVSSIAELISIENELQAKIQMVSSYDGEIEALTKSIQAQKNQLSDNAIQLSQLRKSVTPIIEKKVIEILRQVGIPNAELMLKFNALSDYTASGIDEVSFMFSANKNQELQEIGKIASGGEISRLMLAIKTLITHAQSLPTIIFDEIDAGISGEVALKMGQILESMSAKMQILNITHLPQIAARGNNHYKVYKYDNNEQTFTTIRKLTDNERVEEIAQMLSGEKFSKTAMETAKELLL